MIMATLKICSMYKGSSSGDVLLPSWVSIWKEYPSSVSRIIYFCVYIKSVPSLQNCRLPDLQHFQKETPTQMLPVDIVNFFIENLWWLLLTVLPQYGEVS